MMPYAKPSEHDPLPKKILGFIAVFMRALNTERLYTNGHALFKKPKSQISGHIIWQVYRAHLINSAGWIPKLL